MRSLIAKCAAAALVLTGCTTMHDTADAMSSDISDGSQRSREMMFSVLWMQHAAEYKANAQQTYRAAAAQLEPSLEPGSADTSQSALPMDQWMKKPTAIVFDLDETLLDNSDYQAWYVKNHSGYNEITWNQWVESEGAREVSGAAEFASTASKRVSKMFYVSNRACRNPIDGASTSSEVMDLCPQLMHTMASMKNLNFPYSDDRSSFYLAGMYGALKSKKAIREKIGENYRIVMLIGDNLRDFVEDRAEYMDQKAELDKLWGRRWFMLPNPAYGSWPDEFLTSDVKDAIKATCGERPKGPANWDKTKAWDDCAYPIQYQARNAALRVWDAP